MALEPCPVPRVVIPMLDPHLSNGPLHISVFKLKKKKQSIHSPTLDAFYEAVSCTNAYLPYRLLAQHKVYGGAAFNAGIMVRNQTFYF